MFDGLPIGIAVLDVDGAVAEANDAFADAVGRPLCGLVGARLDLAALFAEATVQAAASAALAAREALTLQGVRLRRRDAVQVDVDLWLGPHAGGAVLAVAPQAASSAPGGATPNQPSYGALQAALERSTAFAAQMVDHANAIIVGLSESGRVELFSHGAAELTGWAIEDVVGRSWFDTLAPPEAQAELEGILHAAVADEAGADEHENAIRCADGRLLQVLWRNRHMTGPSGEPLVVAVGVDVTQQRAAEGRLKALAYLDPLTRLANRALLMDRLAQVLAQAQRDGTQVALFLLDLDHFKDVNDAHGHPAGDALLNAVGERLRACTRAMDTVARLGGDEFAVLQVQSGVAAAVGLAAAAGLADRLVAAFNAPFEVEGLRLRTATSVGVGVGSAVEASELFRRTDMALYRAKAQGRGRWVFYDPDMTVRAQARAARLAALDEALEGGGLDVAYLPTVAARDGRVRGLEALVRWCHDGEQVSARALVDLAEESGRIGALDQAVLRRALRDVQRWAGAGLMVRELAVNVSMAALRDPAYAPLVLAALASHGVAPSRLVVELTERTLGDDPHVGVNLRALRQAGVRLALDDFGDGASPIAALTRLPVERVKVVRRLGEGVTAEGDDLWLATVAFAARLGREVVAEGIETARDFRQVRHAGCNLVQGFLFGRPLTAPQVAALLAQGYVELPDDLH